MINSTLLATCMQWWQTKPWHSPHEVLMASRSSAYFHLLSSYFLAPAAALEAWTCGPLIQETDQKGAGSQLQRPTAVNWGVPAGLHSFIIRFSLKTELTWKEEEDGWSSQRVEVQQILRVSLFNVSFHAFSHRGPPSLFLILYWGFSELDWRQKTDRCCD